MQSFWTEGLMVMVQPIPDESVQGVPRSRNGWWWRLLGLSELYECPPSKTAEERAIALLKKHLSPEQRSQYEWHGYFDVVGGTTGRRYRIHHGKQMNVHVLHASGQLVSSLCFGPRGRLPIGDLLLAQKLALQLFEYEALNVANGMGAPIAYHGLAPRPQS